jgi:hypothetical protein
LSIPPDAITNINRYSCFDKRFATHRCNKATVDWIYNMVTKQYVQCAYSKYSSIFAYETGKQIISKFDENLEKVSTDGIHFFLNKELASTYFKKLDSLCHRIEINGIKYYKISDNGKIFNLDLTQYPEDEKTPGLCLLAVKNNPTNLQYVPINLQTAEMCLIACGDYMMSHPNYTKGKFYSSIVPTNTDSLFIFPPVIQNKTDDECPSSMKIMKFIDKKYFEICREFINGNYDNFMALISNPELNLTNTDFVKWNPSNIQYVRCIASNNKFDFDEMWKIVTYTPYNYVVNPSGGKAYC